MTPIDGNTYTYAGVWPDGPGKGRPRFNTTNPRFPSKKWDETGVEMDGGGSITGWGGGSPNLAAQRTSHCAARLGLPPPHPVIDPPPSISTPLSSHFLQGKRGS